MTWLVLFYIPVTGVEEKSSYCSTIWIKLLYKLIVLFCLGGIWNIGQQKSDVVGLVHYNFPQNDEDNQQRKAAGIPNCCQARKFISKGAIPTFAHSRVENQECIGSVQSEAVT